MRLRTMQAGPAMQIPVFFILFLAPVYVPLALLEGWIHAVARVNPTTYLLEAGPRLPRRRPDARGARLQRRLRPGRGLRPLGARRPAERGAGGLMATRAKPRLGGLDATDLGAWGGFLQTYARVVGRLDAEMRAAHGLSLSAYEVLMRLGRADEGRLRMCDLAASVLLTPSGITRVVDRLAADGLVERVCDPSDRRGRHAVLTEAGLAKLVEAQRTHLAGVREAFLANVSQDEREQLAAIWQRFAVPPTTTQARQG